MSIVAKSKAKLAENTTQSGIVVSSVPLFDLIPTDKKWIGYVLYGLYAIYLMWKKDHVRN